MKWMLDTNTCIALIKGHPERTLRKLRGKSVGQVGISSITLAELQYGVARSRRAPEAAAALAEFLLALEVAGFDAEAGSPDDGGDGLRRALLGAAAAGAAGSGH